MTDNVLVYKFDDLDRCSVKIGQVAEALDRVKGMSDNIRNVSAGYWQGEAYEAFLMRFTELMNAVDTLHGQISRNREKLDRAIALERQNEESLKNDTVSRLSADNIF